MRLQPRSVRGRLTFWYTLVLSLMLLAFGTSVFAVMKRVLNGRSDLFLLDALAAFSNELAAEAAEIRDFDRAVTMAARDVHFGDIDFAFRDSNGQWTSVPSDGGPVHDGMVTTSVDLTRLDPILASEAEQSSDELLATLVDPTGEFRVAWLPRTLAGRELTIVGLQSRLFLQQTLRTAILIFLIAVPIAVIVACFAGYMLARGALSPIVEMSRRARIITAARLDDRLPLRATRDEIGELTVIINDLLGRLEASFAQQRRFVADASHELRTPVSIIRAETDIALARHRTESELRDALLVVDDASGRLSRIVEDLFLLARADAGRQPLRHEELYLNEVVGDAVRGMRGPAALHDIRIDADALPEATVHGDPELIGRLLLNLLDNAIKYSPAGSTVTVRMKHRAGAWEVVVADNGPGIPADAQPHIFDRFYRVDIARSRGERGRTSGAGLGLSIATWIAESHGGSLELVRSGAEGSVFRFTIPTDARDPVGAQSGDERASSALR